MSSLVTWDRIWLKIFKCAKLRYPRPKQETNACDGSAQKTYLLTLRFLYLDVHFVDYLTAGSNAPDVMGKRVLRAESSLEMSNQVVFFPPDQNLSSIVRLEIALRQISQFSKNVDCVGFPKRKRSLFDSLVIKGSSCFCTFWDASTQSCVYRQHKTLLQKGFFSVFISNKAKAIRLRENVVYFLVCQQIDVGIWLYSVVFR
jgi:hypothetical protein